MADCWEGMEHGERQPVACSGQISDDREQTTEGNL
jgi:hypothetical protein